MTSVGRKAPPLPDNGDAVQEKLAIPTVSLKKLIAVIEGKCAPSKPVRFGKGKHTLIILPEAWEELKQMICFGKRRAVNRYEQHYEGLGHYLRDENGFTIIVVTHFMYIYSGNRGPSHATIISGSDASMLDLLEQELAIYNELEPKFNKDEAGFYLDPLLEVCGPSRVVVFGHTHPGIGVFFSQTDHGSHYATDKAPFASVVCDPIQKQMKCMMGVDHADAQIIAYEAFSAQQIDKEDDGIDAECEQPVRPMSKQELAQEIARYANLLLARNGVKGSFDSYRSWRGWMCMDLELKYRTDHVRR